MTDHYAEAVELLELEYPRYDSPDNDIRVTLEALTHAVLALVDAVAVRPRQQHLNRSTP